MSILLRLAGVAMAACFLAAPATSDTHESEKHAKLREAIDNASRSDANKARDRYRHPYATLTFFGLEPDMAVMEVSPGGGWYREILQAYVSGAGRYETYNPGRGSLPAEPVDMVLTFRNVHNWMPRDQAQKVFEQFYAALKPGGTLGVVEHRLPEDVEQATRNGYVKESVTIEMAEAAGFELVDKSDINANPKDTHDHPRGVWTLPPTYALRGKDRDKYAAIGESDRFTLKFRKPE
ncbi:MAG: class I SAM-dependent methyltransferase [Rhodothalassiaceae bacterium]